MTDKAVRPLALVTGASSGIGAALARELAKDGHDLILVARRTEQMRALAVDAAASGVQASVIGADLAAPGAAAGLAAELESRGVAVDVLVNAAGLGDNSRFEVEDKGRIGEMLHVNVLALTELTRLLLPAMVARGRGKVLLVASTAGFQPGPNMAVYCATKAYVLSFGEAIAYELRNSGVTVSVLCPGATRTGFADVAGAGTMPLFSGSMFPVMQASEVARIGYAGLKAGKRVIITGLFNKVGALSGRFSPHSASLAISSRLLGRTD
jgi:short-subunit dehydrogenase